MGLLRVALARMVDVVREMTHVLVVLDLGHLLAVGADNRGGGERRGGHYARGARAGAHVAVCGHASEPT